MAKLIPQIFDHYDREQNWRWLRTELEAHAASGSPRARTLLLATDLALRDHAGFLARWHEAPLVMAKTAPPFARAAELLEAPRFPDFSAPKIFGIGLSRTGTTSLGVALARLGYLHAHFTNPFSGAMLREDDFPLFDSANDTPVSYRFEALDRIYPNARFVLTERSLETWTVSVARHFARWLGTADLAALAARVADPADPVVPPEHAVALTALYLHHGSLRAAYESFEQRVTAHFAGRPEKLLRFNVSAGDGWEKLCAFLGRDVPATPFPRENAS